MKIVGQKFFFAAGKFSTGFFILLLLLISCLGESDKLQISEMNIEAGSLPGSRDITIQSNGRWKIKSLDPWFTSSLSNGYDAMIVTLTWEANPKPEQRVSTIEVSDDNETMFITLKQTGTTIELIDVKGIPGNRVFGADDSVVLVFDRPIQFYSLGSMDPTCGFFEANFRLSNNNTTVHFNLTCASLGRRIRFRAGVVDDNGDRLLKEFDIPFYDKRASVDGRITDYFYDDQSELYWVATKSPNRILALSLELEVVRQFDIDVPPGKIHRNVSNGRIYLLSFDHYYTDYHDSTIYVLDEHTGIIIKKIQIPPPSNYPFNYPLSDPHEPFDIAFTTSGFGIVSGALASRHVSWMIIDSSHNDSIYSFTKPPDLYELPRGVRQDLLEL
jgi:hypothetical protein